MKKIGFTSTIPIEVLLAAKKITPVDLNNIFVSAADPNKFIDLAEDAFFPRNFCAWTKGLYGVIKSENFKTIIAVTEGDCSSNKVLFEVLAEEVEILEFAYPQDKSPQKLLSEIEKLMRYFDVSWQEVKEAHQKAQEARRLVADLKNVRSLDLHLAQVSCSDFCGDVEEFCDLIKKIKPFENNNFLRLAYVGVPPIQPKIYDYLESLGASVVFNEVQRQFAFLDTVVDYENIENFKKQYVEQYLNFTYPYHIKYRISDIKKHVKDCAGIIHYVQSFCHKQVDDILIRKNFTLPIFSLEEDRPGELSERTKIRLEAFVSILKQSRRCKQRLD